MASKISWDLRGPLVRFTGALPTLETGGGCWAFMAADTSKAGSAKTTQRSVAFGVSLPP
ncbi:hypothetical protein GCM10018987_56860 [Streptomyces cremeus]